MESSSAVLSTAVHRVDTIGGAGSGSVVPGRRLTARRSHDLETRSWKLEFRIMNCSQQSSVVWTQFLHSNQSSARIQGGHFNTRSQSAGSLPLFLYLSQQNQVYQWSIHCSIHITPKLTEINTFNKYGHGCSSVSESLSRLPTVGNVALWPHHPDIAPVWPPMRDPCPQQEQCHPCTQASDSAARVRNQKQQLCVWSVAGCWEGSVFWLPK